MPLSTPNVVVALELMTIPMKLNKSNFMFRLRLLPEFTTRYSITKIARVVIITENLNHAIRNISFF